MATAHTIVNKTKNDILNANRQVQTTPRQKGLNRNMETLPAHFSYTRSFYDGCNLNKWHQESIGPFTYLTDPTVVENSGSCFQATFPQRQHSQFQSIPPEIVQAESELRNITRIASRCPEVKYNPKTAYQQHIQQKECSNELVPDFTRMNRPCNILSEVSTFNYHIHPLCDDLQDHNRIHHNVYFGKNSRLAVKDRFRPERYSHL